MKRFFVAVALFCSLLLAACSYDNLITGYVINNRTYNKKAIVGIVEFNYNNDNYYTSSGNGKICYEDVYYHVTAHFDKEDRQTYSDEKKITVNTHQLPKDDNNCYRTSFAYQGKNPDFDVYLGYGKTNTVEKDASELYPAFSHNVSFGKPAKLLNFTPNQIVNKSQDLHISWEASSNELTDYTVNIFSYANNKNGNQVIKFSRTFSLGNVNSLVIPKKVIKFCNGSINHIEISKREAVFIPVEVNRDKFNELEEYKLLYIARSIYRTSFLVR